MYVCLAPVYTPTYLSPSLPSPSVFFHPVHFSPAPAAVSVCYCFSSCTQIKCITIAYSLLHHSPPSFPSFIQSSTQRPRPRPPQPFLPLHLLLSSRIDIRLEPEKRRQNRRHVHQKPQPLEIRQCHRPRSRRQMRW